MKGCEREKNFQRNAGSKYAKYHQLKHLINTPSQSNLKNLLQSDHIKF